MSTSIAPLGISGRICLDRFLCGFCASYFLENQRCFQVVQREFAFMAGWSASLGGHLILFLVKPSRTNAIRGQPDVEF